jgi:hypothetical protein
LKLKGIIDIDSRINFGWGFIFLHELSPNKRESSNVDAEAFFEEVWKRAPASARGHIDRVKSDALGFARGFRLEPGSALRLADSKVLEDAPESALVGFVSEAREGRHVRPAKFQRLILGVVTMPTIQSKAETHAQYRSNARRFDEDRFGRKVLINNSFDPLQRYLEVEKGEEDISDDSNESEGDFEVSDEGDSSEDSKGGGEDDRYHPHRLTTHSLMQMPLPHETGTVRPLPSPNSPLKKKRRRKGKEAQRTSAGTQPAKRLFEYFLDSLIHREGSGSEAVNDAANPKPIKPKKQSDATIAKRALKKFRKQTRDFGNMKSVFHHRLVEQGIEIAHKAAIDAVRVSSIFMF